MTRTRWSSLSAVVAVVLLAGCTVDDPELEPGVESALDVDFASWPQHDDVGAYAAVSTGVVYVDAGTAEIVWESWQHQRKVIGQLGPDALADPDTPGIVWQNRRDIVGDPLHDLVAWVEVVGEAVGHLVVVQASTGEELARTDIRSLTPNSVMDPWVEIASVDEGSLYFSITDFPPPFYRPGQHVWTWRWAAGDSPVNGPGKRVMDVSGGVWAIDTGATLRFEDATGQVLSEVMAAYEDRTAFGMGLSPDGRYWYGPAYETIVNTTTGELVSVDVPRNMTEFGWTGESTLTILSGGYGARGTWVSCNAVSGSCRSAGYCGFAYCGKNMPLQ